MFALNACLAQVRSRGGGIMSAIIFKVTLNAFSGRAPIWRSRLTSRPNPAIFAWLVKRTSTCNLASLQWFPFQEGTSLRTVAPEGVEHCVAQSWGCHRECHSGRASEMLLWLSRRVSAATWKCQTRNRTTLQSWRPTTATPPTQRAVICWLANSPNTPCAEIWTLQRAFTVPQTAM